MIRQPLRTFGALMNAVRQEAAMGSVYRRRELNTRPGGRKNNGGARSGAGRAALRRRGAARGRRRFRLLVKTPHAFDLSAYLRQLPPRRQNRRGSKSTSTRREIG